MGCLGDGKRHPLLGMEGMGICHFNLIAGLGQVGFDAIFQLLLDIRP